MPSEIIQPAQAMLDAHEVAPELAVKVAWGRNTFVQIASVNLPISKERPGDPAGGFYTDLDRHAINQLIRVLRKARDQAYGADE